MAEDRCWEERAVINISPSVPNLPSSVKKSEKLIKPHPYTKGIFITVAVLISDDV